MSQEPVQLSPPEVWLGRYGDDLFRYALRRVSDRQVAEDLVQETLLAALKAAAQFAGRSSERTWLTGILKHKIMDHYRRRRSEFGSDDIEGLSDWASQNFDDQGNWKQLSNDWGDPEKRANDEVFLVALEACLSKMPERLAHVFVMQELDGMSGEEIRKAMDISTTNNVWVMLSRARARLRDCLEQSL